MNADHSIVVLTDLQSMLKQYPLLQQLNPKLTEARYRELLEAMLKQGGYFQVACYLGDQCVGLTGVWLGTKIWCGRYIEVDNFVVDQAYRGRGIGQILVEWVEAKGREEGCEMIGLDTYITQDRAHQFYMSRGFKILGFHMVKLLNPLL